jgi:hypothetical protein
MDLVLRSFMIWQMNLKILDIGSNMILNIEERLLVGKSPIGVK